MPDLVKLDIECQMNGDVKKDVGIFLDQAAGETSISTPLTEPCNDDCSNGESSLESSSVNQKKFQQQQQQQEQYLSERYKITPIEDEESRYTFHDEDPPSFEESITENDKQRQHANSGEKNNCQRQDEKSETSYRLDLKDDRCGRLEVGWNTSSCLENYISSDDEDEDDIEKSKTNDDDGTMFEDFPVLYEAFPNKDEKDEIRTNRIETIENQNNIEEEFDSRRPWRKAPIVNEHDINYGTESDTQTEVSNSDFDTTSISGNENLQMNLYIPEHNYTLKEGYNSGERTPSDRSICVSVSSEITEVRMSKSALSESQYNMNGVNRNLPLSRKYYEQKYKQTPSRKKPPFGLERNEGNLTFIPEYTKSIVDNINGPEKSDSQIINQPKITKNDSPSKLPQKSDSQTNSVIEASLNALQEFTSNGSKDVNGSKESSRDDLKIEVAPSSPGYREMFVVDGQNAPSVQLSKRDIDAAGGQAKARSDVFEPRHDNESQPNHANQEQEGDASEKVPLKSEDSSSQIENKRETFNTEASGLSTQSMSNQSEKNLVDRAFKGFPIRNIRHRGRLERKCPRMWRYRKGFIIGILAFFLVAGTGIVLIQFSPIGGSNDVKKAEQKNTLPPTRSPTRSPTFQPSIGNKPQVVYLDPNIPYVEMQQIFGQASSAQAGTSISFSSDGTVLAIGAPAASGRKPSTGVVYIYKYGQDGYIPLGNSIQGGNTGDEFGWSVSLSSDGSRLAIGARSSSNIKTRNGCVKIFALNDEEIVWEQIGSNINGLENEERSGWSVALSGNGKRVAVGGPQGETAFGENRLGSVTVFEYSDIEQDWIQLGNVRRGAGSSVSLSYDGNTLIFGVFRSSDTSGVTTTGHVEVHRFTKTTSGDKLWTQVGENIVGSDLEDEVGRSVSISSDGSRIAIGVNGFDLNEKTNVGCCRVYDLMEWTDGQIEWVQAGSDLVGDMAGEESGTSVSLSGNGRRVACGGPKSNHNGWKSGIVRVYDITDGTWRMVGSEMVAPVGSEFGSSVALTNDGRYLAIGGPALNRSDRNIGGVIRVFTEKSAH